MFAIFVVESITVSISGLRAYQVFPQVTHLEKQKPYQLLVGLRSLERKLSDFIDLDYRLQLSVTV